MEPERMDTFGQALLAQVALCYRVALQLTQDRGDALKLTREIVTRAWQIREDEDTGVGLKMRLLAALRQRYIEHYRRVPRTVREEVLAESVT